MLFRTLNMLRSVSASVPLCTAISAPFILMIIGTFLKKDVFTLLAGFGAMAAVLMLVFQNTILIEYLKVFCMNHCHNM